MKSISLVLLTFSLIYFSSCCGDCEDDKVYSCGYEVSLEMDVMSIIEANCAVSRCHLDGVNPILTSNSEVIANAEIIRTRVGNGTMPPGGSAPLSQEDIDLILCWVDDGAIDN